MDFAKGLKRCWKWWMGLKSGTRVMIYLLLAWEVIGVIYFVLTRSE